MIDAHVVDGIVTIHEGEFIDADGERVTDLHSFPVNALATYGEQLGYRDALDALEAIHLMPPVLDDPATGEHALSEAVMILAHREQAREAEANRAAQEGTRDDPRSPVLRGTLAAYNALPRDEGGRCVLDQCRAKVRAKLGLPEPTRTPSIVRSTALSLEDEPQCEGPRALTPEQRTKLREQLAPYAEQLQARRARYLHELTGNGVDPFAPDHPEPVPLEDQIRARYGITQEAQDAA